MSLWVGFLRSHADVLDVDKAGVYFDLTLPWGLRSEKQQDFA